MKSNRFFPLKFTAFLGVFLLAVIVWFFRFTPSVHAAVGINGSLTITSINLPLSGGGNPIIGPGRSFDVTFSLCNTTGSNQFITVNGAISAGGSAGSASYLTNAGVCDLHTLNFTSPDISFNNCSPGLGTNIFRITISTLGDFGSDGPRTIQFYAELGLTVRNNRATTIDVEITGTNFGGAIGASFSVSPGGANGPAFIWNVDCGLYPTVTVTITINGVETATGTDNVKNGCRYQIVINVDPTPTPPPPTPPPPTPIPTPTPPPPTPPPPGAIGVLLTANGVRPTLTIPAAANVTLSWTTSGSPDWCVSSANWGGAIVSGAGGLQTVFVSANTTYSITCQKVGTSDTTDSVTVNISPIATPTPTPGPVPNEICNNGIDDDFDGKVDTADPDCPTISGFLTIWQACLVGNLNPELTIQYVPYAPPNIYDTAIILYKNISGIWVWQAGWDDSPSPFNKTTITFPGDYRVLAYHATVGGTFVDNAYFAAVDCSSVPPPTPTPLPSPTPTPGPPAEICGNGIDDDSDGYIDEGCPLPPAPPQAGTNTTVQFCKAYGDIVGFVRYFSTGGVVPPGGVNYMDIFEGSPFALKIKIDPWPASLVQMAGPGFFTSGVTYYFRGYYLGAGGIPNLIDSNPYVITPDFASMPVCPGIPVAAAPVDLEIIAAGIVDPATGLPKTTFLPGEPARASYTIINPNPPAGASVATAVGFWPTGTTSSYGSGAFPICPGTAGVPASGAGVDPIGQIFPPGNTNITFNFTVPNTVGPYFAHAYVSFDCVPNEGPGPPDPWLNNGVSIAYRVGGGDPWFETIGGDVGSEGVLTVAGTPSCPPSTCYTSRYLLAQSSTSPTANTEKWKLTNYSGPQSTGNIYNNLAGRFKSRATSGICNVSSLLPSPASPSPAVFSQCGSSVTLGGSPALPAGNNFVWFIDGDLTITDNFSVPANKTIIFLVSGNINAENDVTALDGIYAAGVTFTDTVGPSNDGPQLNISGAVYAGDVLLDRNCDATCNSLTQPVERITFDPKYIDVLNSIMGTPTITWQEVAP